MRLTDLAKYEVLLTDERIERIAHKIGSEFGFGRLKDTQYVSFIQPARIVSHEVDGITRQIPVAEMAVFAVLTPNPRPYAQKTGQKLMTHATAALADFLEAEAELSHFAHAGKDPARDIYKAVVKTHLKQLDDLRSLTN